MLCQLIKFQMAENNQNIQENEINIIQHHTYYDEGQRCRKCSFSR